MSSQSAFFIHKIRKRSGIDVAERREQSGRGKRTDAGGCTKGLVELRLHSSCIVSDQVQTNMTKKNKMNRVVFWYRKTRNSTVLLQGMSVRAKKRGGGGREKTGVVTTEQTENGYPR